MRWIGLNTIRSTALLAPCFEIHDFGNRASGDREHIRDFTVSNSARRMNGPNFSDLIPSKLGGVVALALAIQLRTKTKMMSVAARHSLSFCASTIAVSCLIIAATLGVFVRHVILVRSEPKIVGVTIVKLDRDIVAVAHIQSVWNLIVRICSALIPHPHHAINCVETSGNKNLGVTRPAPRKEPRPDAVGAFFDICKKPSLDSSRDRWNGFRSDSHKAVCRIVRAIWPLNTALSPVLFINGAA